MPPPLHAAWAEVLCSLPPEEPDRSANRILAGTGVDEPCAPLTPAFVDKATLVKLPDLSQSWETSSFYPPDCSEWQLGASCVSPGFEVFGTKAQPGLPSGKEKCREREPGRQTHSKPFWSSAGYLPLPHFHSKTSIKASKIDSLWLRAP